MDRQLENAFLAALEQNQQKLLRVCSVYAEDADDKKDLFQESLIHIWQSMPTFEERSSISTWMFRITLNVCLRLQLKEEKKKDRFRKLDSVTIESIRAEETNPEEHERLVKLRSCIKKLNDADKAVTTLYLEELSYKEIATITGLSENAIAVKIKRIKIKLLACITENV
jgi:RNA polymerase sigma factor (sigma-70 family)